MSVYQLGDYTEYGYDNFNRLIKVERLNQDGTALETVVTYTYNAMNMRVERVADTTTTYMFDAEGKVLYEETESIVTEYAYLGSKHLVKLEGTETYYYGTDHLGSTTLMTDGTGTEVWSGEVTPFGDHEATDGLPNEHVKFTGKDWDEEAELFYFSMRWYDPEAGRFITEDPARYQINWYVYAGNNPLRFIDPTGLSHGEAYWHAMQAKYDDSVDTSTEATSNRETKDWDDNHTSGEYGHGTIVNDNTLVLDPGTYTGNWSDPNSYDSASYFSYLDGSATVEYLEGDVVIQLPNGFVYVPELGAKVPASAVIQTKDDGIVFLNNGKYRINITNGGNSSFEGAIGNYYGYLKSEEYNNMLRDQKILGVTEMVAGFCGFLIAAAAEQPSCLMGLYVMADGGYLVSQALRGNKAEPGTMLLLLLKNR